jgi:Ca-activated chloride channel family protein
MSFASPYLLLTLLLVPLIAAAAVIVRRRRGRYAVSFTNVDVLARVAGSGRSRSTLGLIPLALLLLGLAVAGVATAKPELKTTVAEKQAVVVMLVDVSGSMQATDVHPTRIQAAVNAMQGFVARLPAQADVGLVEFSDQPQVIALPTTDHEQVLQSLPYLTPNGGTALGDGISTAVAVIKSTGVYAAVRRLQGSTDPAGAIVLLSDGAQNRGTATPEAAANEARAAGIPIYAIAFGTPTGKVAFPGYGAITVPPDPQTMKQLARITGGRAFDVETAAQAASVYNGLGTEVGRVHSRRALAAWFAVAAAIVLAGAALLSRVFGPALL